MTSNLLPLHEAVGARFLDRRGLRLAAAYGEGPEAVAAEYAAARSGAALVDLPDRQVLAVTGPKRQGFLHGLLSNDVDGLLPGQGRLAALMDPKGHLLALMRVLVAKDTVLLELPAERLAPVHERLLFYKVAAPVRFAELGTVVTALLGPTAPDVLRAAGGEPPGPEAEAHVETTIAGHPVRVVRAGDLPAGAHVIHASLEHARPVWLALGEAGARPLGRLAFDALRVEDGRPLYGEDVTEANLLHETGLLAEYHSPRKGCYIGQEVVARLEARGGNVNKRLRGLRLGQAALAGEAVGAGDAEVGRLTTVAFSPRTGHIALGYVHRDHAEPGTSLRVGGAPATVAALPLEGR